MAELNKNEQILERYHNGLISKSEFEDLLRDNQDLVRLHEEYQLDMVHIRVLAKEEVKSQTIEILEKKRKQKWLLSILGSIILVLSLAFLFNKLNNDKVENTENLYATYYQPSELSNQRSSNSGSLNKSFENALIAYSKKDYKKAILIFEETINDPAFSSVDEGILYLGISNLELNQTEIALSHFTSINADSYFSEEADWYIALSLLKLNRIDETKEILHKIAVDSRHYKQKLAIELLKKIEKI